MQGESEVWTIKSQIWGQRRDRLGTQGHLVAPVLRSHLAALLQSVNI